MNDDMNQPHFTEGDSPVPLIPPDQAWDAMHKKLEDELPEKKKRRMLLWLPPVGCALLALIIIAGGSIVWWYSKSNKDSAVEKLSANTLKTENGSRSSQPVASDNTQTATSATTKKELLKENSQPTDSGRLSTATKHIPEEVTHRVKEQQEDMLRSSLPRRKVRVNKAVVNGASNNSKDPDLVATRIAAISRQANILVKVQEPLPVATDPSSPARDSTPKDPITLSFGLQWQRPIPIGGARYYLKGPDGIDQWTRQAIPAAWIYLTKQKHRLALELIPFATTTLPVKRYATEKIERSPGDSVLAYKSMVKVFGYQGGLHYAYQLRPHWWLGGGIDATWWKKGLVLAQGVSDTLNENPFLYSTTSKQEERLQSFQLSAGLEIGYQYHGWEGLLQYSMPFNATVKGLNPPLWLKLAVRWRLCQCQMGGKKNP